jgi:hypothetical protein
MINLGLVSSEMYLSFFVCFAIVASQATTANVAKPDLAVFEATIEPGCRNSTCSTAIQMRKWLTSLNERLYYSVTEYCKRRCCEDSIPDWYYMEEITEFHSELTQLSREIAEENQFHKKSWSKFHPLLFNATLNFKQARDLLSLVCQIRFSMFNFNLQANSKECQCETIDCTPKPDQYAEFFGTHLQLVIIAFTYNFRIY